MSKMLLCSVAGCCLAWLFLGDAHAQTRPNVPHPTPAVHPGYYPPPWYPYWGPSYYPRGMNPEYMKDVAESPLRFQGFHFDPVAGYWMRNAGVPVPYQNPSTVNPNKPNIHIDHGSIKYIDRWVPDPKGGWVHEIGYEYTSYGVRHQHIQRVHTDANYGKPSAPDASAFDRLDADKDGKISKEEWKGLKK